MKTLLILDAKNYPKHLGEIRRVAVRGIIFLDDKLLLTENTFGEVKLPGGGIEPGESETEALIREVNEETGYNVIPDSIVPFGAIEEKRLSIHEPMIWHQISRLYFCRVASGKGPCHYSEHEKKYGFRQALYTVEEALEKNRRMLKKEGIRPWNQREYQTFLLIKEYLTQINGL